MALVQVPNPNENGDLWFYNDKLDKFVGPVSSGPVDQSSDLEMPETPLTLGMIEPAWIADRVRPLETGVGGIADKVTEFAGVAVLGAAAVALAGIGMPAVGVFVSGQAAWILASTAIQTAFVLQGAKYGTSVVRGLVETAENTIMGAILPGAVETHRRNLQLNDKFNDLYQQAAEKTACSHEEYFKKWGVQPARAR